MRRLNMGGLAALSVAFGLGCSKTTVETPAPAASTGATTTTTTTATADTASVKKDSAVGYVASGSTAPATSTTVTTTTTATDTTHAAAAQSAMAQSAMPQSAGPQTLQLDAQNGSGFTGNAILTDRGDKTNVALTLNSPANTNASMDHNAAIRSGTCAAPGEKVAGLHDVTADGKASNTDVDFRIGQLADGQHVIVVNENPGDRAVACVAIPGR